MMRAMMALSAAVLSGATCMHMQAQDTGNLKPAPHAYHLTYTLTEMGGAKRIGVQHYTISITDDDQSAEVQMDSKVPVEVGSGNDSKIVNMEVGLTFGPRLREFSNGLELHSYVRRSGVELSGLAASSNSPLHLPLIRNLNLMNTALLTPGRSVLLGSFDEPGSIDHLDVEVLLEPIR